jgi:predicted sulfurtransferase
MELTATLPPPADGSALWRAYGLDGNPVYVILFYQYTALEDAVAEAASQREHCSDFGLTGRLLVASEGINGTLCGPSAAIERYVAWMRSRPCFVDVDWKGSTCKSDCFADLHVRVTKEIIATGGAVKGPHEAGAEPEGEELAPEVFHERLAGELGSTGKAGEDWVLLDCRNENESAVGTFQGALRVPMRNFAEFPKWTQDNAELIEGKRVMMFCTGGIRCRKGSAIVGKLANPAEVVQLKGGIHRYLETYPEGGLWQGRNFVFDKRQSLAPLAKHRALPSELASGKEEEAEAEAEGAAGRAGACAEAAAVGDVYGKCHVCSKSWEEFCGRDVCQVCRFLLLVCPGCRAEKRSLFYCRDHARFEGSYLWWLGDSTEAELEEQRAALKAMHAEVSVGRSNRNRRRTLSRQMARIDSRLAELRSGSAEAAPRVEAHPCRTCEEPACKGDCWGFWSSKVEEQRAEGTLRARDQLYLHPEAPASAVTASETKEGEA